MSTLLLAAMALVSDKDARPLFTAVDKRIIVARYADCVVKRHPAEAVSYVEHMGQEPSAPETKALADGKCLSKWQGAYPTSLRLRGSSAVLALADALVRSGRVGTGASAPATPAAIIDAEPEASVEPMRVGQCLVTRHGDVTRALLASEVGSDVETRALTALQPALANCGAGKSLALTNASQVRGWAAVATLRHAPTPAGAAA